MNWSILINNFLGGFAPAWYKETYPIYGNKNQAGAMQNADITNPGYLSQGPGLANLTNGTQAGAVTTLIKGILESPTAADTTYAVGGNTLYKISSTAVIDDATWSHTIDKATVTAELGEDTLLYHGVLYYSYNHSGTAGDIGSYDLSSTFDDDWGSTVPSGMAALQDGPHQMIIGGNDVMYIANGRYVASWDGTTLIPQALDLPTGAVIQSLKWMADRLWIAANKTSLTGSNKVGASVYIWDGTTPSWETELPLMGMVGGLHVKNGVLFVFYKDISHSGGFKLAYLNGATVIDLANYTGGLPAFYQITDYKDFIIWDSAGLIYAFGGGDKDMPVRLFQLADSGYTTAGGIACPFGTPLVASNETTSYKLAKFSGLDVASNWKSLMFDVTGDNRISRIKRAKINFETLASGARVDWKLLDNQGRTLYSDIISYAKLGAVSKADYPLNLLAENFRIEFDYTNGSTSNAVKIKNTKIYGSTE